MKYLLIICGLLTFLFVGCNENCDTITSPVDDRIVFETNFLQYSDNNYFIDQIYTDTSSGFNIYNLYYGSQTPTISKKYYVKNIEVYISINQISQTYTSIIAHAYLNLPPRSPSVMYPDSLRNNNNVIIIGQEELGRFRLLNEGRDYLFHPETGYITFLFPILSQDRIAVAYRIENEGLTDSDDLIYGEFISELVNNSKAKAVLKLVKPANLFPAMKDAWNLKMKNIYQINPDIEQIKDLDLDIFLKRSDGSETDKINNIGLLELFGFDRVNKEGIPGSDGKFDDIPGINYDPRTGQIIFPVIQPFGNNIPALLRDYKYQAIYDTLKSYLTMPGNSFIIRGEYKPE